MDHASHFVHHQHHSQHTQHHVGPPSLLHDAFPLEHVLQAVQAEEVAKQQQLLAVTSQLEPHDHMMPHDLSGVVHIAQGLPEEEVRTRRKRKRDNKRDNSGLPEGVDGGEDMLALDEGVVPYESGPLIIHIICSLSLVLFSSPFNIAEKKLGRKPVLFSQAKNKRDKLKKLDERIIEVAGGMLCGSSAS